jgi:hypothetical protein
VHFVNYDRARNGFSVLLAYWIVQGFRPCIRHLEEVQVAEPVDIVTIAHPIIPEDVAVDVFITSLPFSSYSP